MPVKHAGFVAKLGLCWPQLTAEDQLESQGIQGGPWDPRVPRVDPQDPRAHSWNPRKFHGGPMGRRAPELGS